MKRRATKRIAVLMTLVLSVRTLLRCDSQGHR